MKNSLELQTGGWVRGDSLYVTRKADDILHNHIKNNDRLICIAEPHQTGKTSLAHKMCDQLKNEAIDAVFVDLQNIMSYGATEIRCYFSIARRINKELDLSNDEIKMLWEKHLEDPQAFCRAFFASLAARSKKLVIFIDELGMIQVSESGFDGFFSSIPEFQNITFVLSGVFTTHFIGKHSPGFTRLEKTYLPLDNFTKHEMKEFSTVLEKIPGLEGEKVTEEIFNWTNGQPYMSQRVCEGVLNSFAYQPDTPLNATELIAQIVDDLFLEDGVNGDINLASTSANFDIFIEEPGRRAIAFVIFKHLIANGRYLVGDNLSEAFKQMIKNVLKEMKLPVELKVDTQMINDVIEDMRVCGLVIRNENSEIIFRNEICRRVFNDGWIKQKKNWVKAPNTEEAVTSNE